MVYPVQAPSVVLRTPYSFGTSADNAEQTGVVSTGRREWLDCGAGLGFLFGFSPGLQQRRESWLLFVILSYQYLHLLILVALINATVCRGTVQSRWTRLKNRRRRWEEERKFQKPKHVQCSGDTHNVN